MFRELVGETTALSANTVVRLKEHWGGEYEAWRQRPLGEHRCAYIWADGVYLAAGTEKTALLCVLGARRAVARDSEIDSGHKPGGCGECTLRNCTYNDFVVSPT